MRYLIATAALVIAGSLVGTGAAWAGGDPGGAEQTPGICDILPLWPGCPA